MGEMRQPYDFSLAPRRVLSARCANDMIFHWPQQESYIVNANNFWTKVLDGIIILALKIINYGRKVLDGWAAVLKKINYGQIFLDCWTAVSKNN